MYLQCIFGLLESTQTLSTIVEVSEEREFPNLVADVEAARARLSTRIQQNLDESTSSRQFLGRRASTFNPRSSLERVVLEDDVEMSTLSGSYDFAL